MTNEELIKSLRAWDGSPFDDDAHDAADRIEELEAKLTKAVAFIRRHIPDSVYEQRQRANAFLAELEGGEEATVTAWRGRE